MQDDEKFDDLQTILHSSKEFSFEDGTILKLRQYYGNKEVRLDLSKLDIDKSFNLSSLLIQLALLHHHTIFLF